MEPLKKNADFQRVYRNGRVFGNRCLVGYVLNRDDREPLRLGISVSKKVGNSVVRHRIKRLVREIFGVNRQLCEEGCDIVIVAKKEAKGKTYSEMEKAVFHLTKNLLSREIEC